jgi:hypothetical protein
VQDAQRHFDADTRGKISTRSALEGAQDVADALRFGKHDHLRVGARPLMRETGDASSSILHREVTFKRRILGTPACAIQISSNSSTLER